MTLASNCSAVLTIHAQLEESRKKAEIPDPVSRVQSMRLLRAEDEFMLRDENNPNKQYNCCQPDRVADLTPPPPHVPR